MAACIVGRYFPLSAYTKVVGLAFLLLAEGGALGIFLVGQLYVASGGYALPMVVLALMVVREVFASWGSESVSTVSTAFRWICPSGRSARLVVT